MCGIAALFSLNGSDVSRDIAGMTDLIRHRGPDDAGFALLAADGKLSFHGDADTPTEVYSAFLPYAPATPLCARSEGVAVVALGHRRLSIVDLTPSGHQPMCDTDRRYVIVFNGEIYNHIELRSELEAIGCRFRSPSDTEVLLQAYRAWGSECLHRLNGMFAFVIVDTRDRKVFGARDRFGVKPFYFWFSPRGMLAMASEIKQFSAVPGWEARLNRQAGYDFLRWGAADDGEQTMFTGVRQLRGGQCFEGAIADLRGGLPVRDWYRPRPEPVTLGFEEAADRLRELFIDSVRLRLRADVPVGTGLSGGLDSSSIVCAVNEQLRRDESADLQNTFSACSEFPEFDERPFIEEVVRKTAVRSRYTFPRIEEVFGELDRMVWHQDEPFHSTSICAEWSVFKLVGSTPVKVTLEGHGADELLAGYHNFFGTLLGGLLRNHEWRSFVLELRAIGALHGRGAITQLSADVAKAVFPLGTVLALRRAVERMLGRGHWLDAAAFGTEERDPLDIYRERSKELNGLSEVQLLHTSLPKQLHWCDRDSMAFSIESRMPFLDYRLVEFILGCPAEYKLGQGWTKRILRRAMHGLLPERIENRIDKMGFVTSEEAWARQIAPREFEAAVARAVRDSGGLIDKRATELAARMTRGAVPYNTVLWRIITFGTWMRRFSVQA